MTESDTNSQAYRTPYKMQYDKDHYKSFLIKVPKQEYEDWKAYADSINEPLITMIKRLVRSQIQSDSNSNDQT